MLLFLTCDFSEKGFIEGKMIYWNNGGNKLDVVTNYGGDNECEGKKIAVFDM